MTIDHALAERSAADVRTAGWTAKMIRPEADAGVGTQASFLRRTFTVDGGPAGATLRISALGLYRCFINGTRVGDDLLTPGWTSYWDRLSFQTYDVSEHLKAGDNTIDIWLGDGWYRSRMMWPRESNPQHLGQRDRRYRRAALRRRQGPARHRRHVAERARADPQVGHLLRRDFRRTRREPAGHCRQRRHHRLRQVDSAPARDQRRQGTAGDRGPAQLCR